jgi:TctA family transporter
MPHQPLTAVLAAATTDTGSHPGPAAFVLWALIIAAIIGTPVYVVRQVRERRKRH